MNKKVMRMYHVLFPILFLVIILLACSIVWIRSGGVDNTTDFSLEETSEMKCYLEQYKEELLTIDDEKEQSEIKAAIADLEKNIQINEQIRNFYVSNQWAEAYQLEIEKLQVFMDQNESLLDPLAKESLSKEVFLYKELSSKNIPLENEMKNPPALLFSLTFFESLMPFFFTSSTLLLSIYYVYVIFSGTFRSFLSILGKSIGVYILVLGIPLVFCALLNGIGRIDYPVIIDSGNKIGSISNGVLFLKTSIIQGLIISLIVSMVVLFKQLSIKWYMTIFVLLLMIFVPSLVIQNLGNSFSLIGYYPFTYHEALYSIDGTINHSLTVDTVILKNGVLSIAASLGIIALLNSYLRRRADD